MPSRARDKQLAKLAAQRKADREAAVRRRRVTGGLVGVAVGIAVIVAGALILFGDGDGTSNASGSPSASASASPSVSVQPKPGKPVQTGTVTPEATPPGRIACNGQVPAAAADPKPQFDRPPAVKMFLDDTKDYAAVVDTSCGSFTIALDAKVAPQTVASFVFLARHHFFDGLTFNRIVPGFVIQTGDPLGTGAGGPGYTFGVEVDPKLNFDHVGQVAMARGNAKDTNGSQWFVTTGEASSLDQLYTIFGDVTSGLDVVKTIGKVQVGGDAGDQPQLAVYVVSVTIHEQDRSA
jgi:cyclophilin family peptidyl-prolyl cis-trans isomerase